ncbi:MAG: hypothetical protein WCD12_22320 [Candidatus Binatus sp.]
MDSEIVGDERSMMKKSKRKTLPAIPRMTIAAMILLVLSAGASAQNLPPPGSYQPIPNFTGVGAGLQFREAINERFSGAQPIAPSITTPTFANLPPEQDGMLLYCENCRSATPCVSGGDGAYALGTRGQWACAGAALEATLNANGNKVSNLASGTINGDALAFGQTGAQLNTLSGSKLDGSDAIANVSLNGVKNVRAFGATGSLATVTATTSASNAVITVNSIADFKVGNWIKIDHAGAASNANPPTGVTVVPNSYGMNPNPTSDITKSVANGGGCEVDSQTGNPAHNSACNVSYTYQIVGVSNGGGWSVPTAAVSTSAGPATLSTNNNLLVSWTGAANDIAYLVYSCSGAGCTPSLHAVVPHAGAPGATAESYRDFGHAFGTDEDFGTALGSSAVVQDLFAQITGVNGVSVTLSIAPAQTGSFTMRHDDSVPINAAISSICSHTATGATVGGIVEFPATSAYPLGQSLNLYGCWGVTLSLTGAQNGDGGHPVELEWHGVTGGTVINMNKAADSRVAGLSVSGINGNTAGVIIDVDNYATGGGGDGLATQHDTFERLALGRAGIGIRVANQSAGNVQNLSFHDVQISNPSNGQGGMWGYFFGGAGQTYNEEIRGGLIQGHDVAIMSDFVGQLEIYGTDFEQNKIEAWTVDRFGGGADGNMMFSGVTSEDAQYFIFDTNNVGSNFIIDATRIAGAPGPNGFLMQLNRPTAIKSSWVCGGGTTVCGISNGNAPNPQPIFSMQNSYGDPSPFRNGDGSNAPDSMIFTEFTDWLASGVVRVGYLNHASNIEACSNVGTVSANTTLAFSTNSCQKLFTATTGLTYTLSTTGLVADQVVTIESYITGAIAAGPLWATSSGAIKWTGGAAPTSSIASGSVDVLRLKWDGTNWLEISRSIGDH